MPAYPNVVIAGTATACGMVFCRPHGREKYRHDVGAAETDQRVPKQRDRANRDRSCQHDAGSAASSPPIVTTGRLPIRATTLSPTNRPNVIAIEKLANAKPACAGPVSRCSVSRTALQSSMEPSTRKTMKHSTPRKSTTPRGIAKRRTIRSDCHRRQQSWVGNQHRQKPWTASAASAL